MSSSAVRISSTASSDASMFSASMASPASRSRSTSGRRVEARGIEGLQDVVAGGGEEPGLGDVRLVGLGLGADQRLVQPGQLLGALADALFQGLVARRRLSSSAATVSVTSV